MAVNNAVLPCFDILNNPCVGWVLYPRPDCIFTLVRIVKISVINSKEATRQRESVIASNCPGGSNSRMQSTLFSNLLLILL